MRTRIEFVGALILLSAQSSPLSVMGWILESKWGTTSSTTISQYRFVALERNRQGWKGVRVTLGPHEELISLTRRNWALGKEELEIKSNRAPGKQ